uniref:Uncharacterized protein n=1 Tax=Arundo donax TaxID=35708 RepID=A0A0A9GN67_ARUDO
MGTRTRCSEADKRNPIL